MSQTTIAGQLRYGVIDASETHTAGKRGLTPFL